MVPRVIADANGGNRGSVQVRRLPSGWTAMMSEWCAGGHKDMEETSLRYTATAPRACSGFVMQAGVLHPCECPCHSK